MLKIRRADTYHVDQNAEILAAPFLEQLSGIVLLPLLLLVLAKVALECLLAPGAVDWVADRSKRGDRLVLARITEELFNSISIQNARRNAR